MIKVSMPKAREITHTERRLKRDEEMKQFDIDATVPVKARQAEAARQAIRDKHVVIQTDIDAAETGDDLIQIIKSL